MLFNRRFLSRVSKGTGCGGSCERRPRLDSRDFPLSWETENAHIRQASSPIPRASHPFSCGIKIPRHLRRSALALCRSASTSAAGLCASRSGSCSRRDWWSPCPTQARMWPRPRSTTCVKSTPSAPRSRSSPSSNCGLGGPAGPLRKYSTVAMTRPAKATMA